MQFDAYHFPSRRSSVMARQGMVATSQPLAAQAGLAVLQAGGNAVDAAVATAAALCVTEPCSTGLGGDAFALIWSASESRLYGLNASGPAPEALTADLVRSQGHTTFPALGPLAVTVPGAAGGWAAALERFGSLSLDRLLAPAIDYASRGYPVSPHIARAWRHSEAKMSAHEDSRRVWLPGGRAPQPGEVFRNPDFAATLTTLAADGLDALYQGAVGRHIVACVREAGGVLSMADLAAYEPE